MWKIKHIFDGNYGCEEASEEQSGELSLTLINENGEERYVSVFLRMKPVPPDL